ncbi:MAG: hypothetical protein F6K47_35650 [Symploca sp. SIO2E6]|nr:hypothetical protein [Symploca sp. SIO2E6]
MQSALDQFRISLGRVRDLIALYDSIRAQATDVLDLSDILRAALVLAVSALDYYVHEVVRLGMLEIHRGQRPEPTPSPNASQSAFSRFQISLGSARVDRGVVIDMASWLESEMQQSYGYDMQQSYTIPELIPALSNCILNRLNNASWLEDEIRERHGYLSFQTPDKIADAIRLISNKKLWDEIAEQIGRPTKDIKQQLSLIVERRNKIAHEADIDPSYNLGTRWEIDKVQVSDAINFIEQVVESIHQIL